MSIWSRYFIHKFTWKLKPDLYTIKVLDMYILCNHWIVFTILSFLSVSFLSLCAFFFFFFFKSVIRSVWYSFIYPCVICMSNRWILDVEIGETRHVAHHSQTAVWHQMPIRETPGSSSRSRCSFRNRSSDLCFIRSVYLFKSLDRLEWVVCRRVDVPVSRPINSVVARSFPQFIELVFAKAQSQKTNE